MNWPMWAAISLLSFFWGPVFWDAFEGLGRWTGKRAIEREHRRQVLLVHRPLRPSSAPTGLAQAVGPECICPTPMRHMVPRPHIDACPGAEYRVFAGKRYRIDRTAGGMPMWVRAER